MRNDLPIIGLVIQTVAMWFHPLPEAFTPHLTMCRQSEPVFPTQSGTVPGLCTPCAFTKLTKLLSIVNIGEPTWNVI